MNFSGWKLGMFVGLLGLFGALSGCKVETSREGQPGTDGSATTIKVSPMNGAEMKQATSKAYDETVEAAQKVKDAAATAGQDAGVAAEAIRARHEAEARGTSSQSADSMTTDLL